MLKLQRTGGEGGIRTPGTGVSPYNGLANRRLQPLGHLSGGQGISLSLLDVKTERRKRRQARHNSEIMVSRRLRAIPSMRRNKIQ